MLGQPPRRRYVDASSLASHSLNGDSAPVERRGAGLPSVAARETQILFDTTRFSALPAVAAALVFAAYFLKTAPAAPIGIWLGAFVFLVLAREAIQFAYHRAGSAGFRRWRGALRVWALANGIAWASAALLVADPVSTEARLFTGFWIAAVAVSGCFAFSIDLVTSIGHALPSAAAAVLLLARGPDAGLFLAGGIGIVFLYALYLAVRSHNAMQREIALQLNNQGLMESIRSERDRAEQLNREIRAEVERRAEAERALREAYERAARLSARDPLTGIANRREFDRVLEREFARARRARTPLSLVLLDIDHFKRFNDYYGHLAGDRCLQKVAAILETHARRGADVAARYGGEEFVLLLPETDETDALDIAERIRAALVAAELEHKASPLGPFVTASLGVATLVPGGEYRPSVLVAAADVALYRAKAAGRNRVARHSESVEHLSRALGSDRLLEGID